MQVIEIKNRRVYRGPGFYVGRPSPLGNPFSVKVYGRENAIKKYKVWFYKNKDSLKISQVLDHLIEEVKAKGKLILICW